MMPNASRSSGSVIHSGGLVKNVFQRTNGVEPFGPEKPAERRHLVRRPVERRQRLALGAVANELDDAEEPDRSHGADRRMPLLKSRQQLLHQHAHAPRVVDQPVVLVDLNRRERRRARQRMAVVGEAAVEHLVPKMIRDRPAHADGAERHVRARQPLRHRQDVGHDVPVIDRKPLAGAAEARTSLRRKS